MLKYPVVFEEDDDSVLVTSPDFPELTTYGSDQEEAKARAVDALEEAIAARIHDGMEIRFPSKGGNVVVLPEHTAVKVLQYMGRRGF